MGRQRNTYQMKEQENSPEEVKEMEVSNLSHIEFRVMIIILNNVKKNIETIKRSSQKYRMQYLQ